MPLKRIDAQRESSAVYWLGIGCEPCCACCGETTNADNCAGRPQRKWFRSSERLVVCERCVGEYIEEDGHWRAGMLKLSK